jgi:2-keto-3-deoxy-6-phosphogluconate aldolase
MAGREFNRQKVDAAVRKSGVVAVMTKKHVKKPQHFVDTMVEIYTIGFVCECTFQIDPGILREGMVELVKLREQAPPEKPFVLGVGSIINPEELDMALEMGFDMVVSPTNGVGGYLPSIEFVKRAHAENRFCIPAVFTPTELSYFIERGDGNEPDAVKIFPSRSHGPKGVGDLLSPFVRERHRGRIAVLSGAVNYENGPEFIKEVSSRGYFPVLGMTAPLQLVDQKNAPGDVGVIRESLETFKAKLEETKAKAL